MSEVWSCGGGTQSAAIAALIVQGQLPRPDLAVMADTGREASAIWRFFEDTLQPELKSVGVDLIRIDHSFDGTGWNTVDIFSGKNKDTIIMPMFTNINGQNSLGMLSKYCSNEWKSRPVHRVIRKHGYTEGRIWIGFSREELGRTRRFDDSANWNHCYPLIDKRLNRGDCISIVEQMGWGTPPRSACWMCPYRSDQEWVHLKRTDPDDFERAVKLEKELQAHDPHVYFHNTCKPLGEVGFNENQIDMFEKPCASGMCFT